MTDTLPFNPSELADKVFTAKDVADLLELSMDTVGNWAKCGLLVPGVRQGAGKGTPRLYNAQDVRTAFFIRRLYRKDWKPKQIGVALMEFRRVVQNPALLDDPLLIHQGKAVLILVRHRDGTLAVRDATAPDQYVLTIALEALDEETRRGIAQNK